MWCGRSVVARVSCVRTTATEQQSCVRFENQQGEFQGKSSPRDPVFLESVSKGELVHAYYVLRVERVILFCE